MHGKHERAIKERLFCFDSRVSIDVVILSPIFESIFLSFFCFYFVDHFFKGSGDGGEVGYSLAKTLKVNNFGTD